MKTNEEVTKVEIDTTAAYGVIDTLYHTICDKKNDDPKTSYTAKLLQGDENSMLKKVVEESGEFTFAIKDNDTNEIIYEAADIAYHVLVALASKNVSPDRVKQEIARRFGMSGIEEKNSRTESDYYQLRIGSSGLDIDLQKITCDNPAFTENGNVCYHADVVLSNSVNNNANIVIENLPFLMSNATGVNASTNATIISCTGGSLSLPHTITPGSSVTACIEFCRPFGEDLTVIGVNYHNEDLPNFSMTEYDADTLPNCVCNLCEGWIFESKNKQVNIVNNTTANLEIEQEIQIANADLIKQVKADIIFVKYNVNDSQCYTCTKEDDHMGMFSNQDNSGLVTTTPSEWENNGQGELSDENEDNYGNEFTWCTSGNGVDFTTPRSYKMKINMPELSSLSCCESTYKICIRYTFTDVNCNTCSFTECYEVSTNPETID